MTAMGMAHGESTLETTRSAGCVVWFTGLPGSGKTTIAKAVEQRLRERGLLVENLDGDEVRRVLSPLEKWSKQDIDRHLNRVTWVAQVLARNGVIALISAVAPYQEFRARARAQIENFVEVYVRCPLEVCQERDPQGLFKRVEEGTATNVPGVHFPYEESDHPELILDTDQEPVEASVEHTLRRLEELGYLAVYSEAEKQKVIERLSKFGYL